MAYRDELNATETRALADGQHERVADALDARGAHGAAGELRSEIWDFVGAVASFRAAGDWVRALEAALEADDLGVIGPLLEDIRALAGDDAPALLQACADLLQHRGHAADAARLIEANPEGSRKAFAEAMTQAGDPVAAAKAMGADGAGSDPHAALRLLEPLLEADDPDAFRVAAPLWWAMGDPHAAARACQRVLRVQPDDEEVRALLARALGTLGHDVAAQIVLDSSAAEGGDTTAPAPGRYRITQPLPHAPVGRAYTAIDRMTMEEVEVHLLLADIERPSEEILHAVDAFAAEARAASRIDHAGIRRVHRIEPELGLLVLPRAEGPTLDRWIREPGMFATPARARALVAFVLTALARAHERGLVHGAVYPSTMVSDRLGRPLLGPFGAHRLAGLQATRTASLREQLALSAPETGDGSPPIPASDVFSAGVILRALLLGSLSDPSSSDPSAPAPSSSDPSLPAPPDAANLAPQDANLIAAMTRAEPGARPSAARAAEALRHGSPADESFSSWNTELFGGPSASASGLSTTGAGPRFEAWADARPIVAGPGWSDERLDALCHESPAWAQPILDRDGRALVLAPWPENLEAHGWTAGHPDGPAPHETLEALTDNDERAVVTSAGTRMWNLESLLRK